jgi:hypothetical protein
VVNSKLCSKKTKAPCQRILQPNAEWSRTAEHNEKQTFFQKKKKKKKNLRQHN